MPPTACATAPASLPACTFAVRSLVTPATMETFESSPEASTTTAALPLVAQGIDQRAQLLAIHTVHLRGQNLDALDILRTALDAGHLGLRELGL